MEQLRRLAISETPRLAKPSRSTMSSSASSNPLPRLLGRARVIERCGIVGTSVRFAGYFGMIAHSRPLPAPRAWAAHGTHQTRARCLNLGPQAASRWTALQPIICMKIRRLTPVVDPPIFARLRLCKGACHTSITVSDGRWQICDNPGGVGVTARADVTSCKDGYDRQPTRHKTSWMTSNNKVSLGCRSALDSRLPSPGESLKCIAQASFEAAVGASNAATIFLPSVCPAHAEFHKSNYSSRVQTQ